MSKLRVAILFGGKSGEHEVSIVSALSVYKALDKNKYDVTLVGIDKDGRWLLPEQTQLLAQSENPRLIKLNEVKNTVSMLPFETTKTIVSVEPSSSTPSEMKFDVVVPILHGTYGEDGTIQGLLELAHIPYVGSGVLGSSVGMDKDMAKRVLRDAGIPVVPFQTVRKSEFKKNSKIIVDHAIKEFGFPFFVKPANLGSSVGVHKVKNEKEAYLKIEDAFLYDTKVLIEKAIDARELEVSVLGNENPRASVVGEIVPQHEFYSYEAKYIDENGALLKIPAELLTNAQSDQIRDMAVKAFLAIECQGLARVDFFLDRKSGKIYINELNTIPGFTSISMYPKLWAATGLKYADLLDELIKLAIERHRARKELKTTYEPKY